MKFAAVPEPATSAFAAAAPAFPRQPLHGLDALWIQVAGSRCNLTCAHCFVSSGPNADHHQLLSRERVARHVAEGVALGAREFYLTGGEPFLHPEIEAILADTLAHGPCTVLTNGTLFTASRVAVLRQLSEAARYSLEIRVSFDGASPAGHDALRGPGSFERAMRGLRLLADQGLLPIATVTETGDSDELAFRDGWIARLAAAGIPRPRLKVLPMFRLGREAGRTRGYAEGESLAGLAPAAFDSHRLQCGSSRAITSRGVFVCPLLVDDDSARMSGMLAGGLGDFELRHGACLTCYVTGMTCANG